MVLVTLWIRVGFNMIIYLAGLQAVPGRADEAAAVEGANGWQRFRYITLPLLGPSTFFLIIMNVIYAFQVFDTVFVLTNGGPDRHRGARHVGVQDGVRPGPRPGLRRRDRRRDLLS